VVAPFLTFARYVFSRSASDDSQVSRPTERGKFHEHSTSSYSYQSLGPLGPLGGSRPWLVQHRPGRRAVAGAAAGVAIYRDSGQRSHDPRLRRAGDRYRGRSEEHTSELQSRENLVCRLLLEKKKRSNILV